MPRPARPTLFLPRRWRPPGPVWRRRVQAGMVLLGVLLLHAWVVGPAPRPLGRVMAEPHAPVMQMVTLAPPKPPEQPPPPGPAEAPTPPKPVAEAAPTQLQPEVELEPAADWDHSSSVERVAGTVITPADVSQPVRPPPPLLVDDAASAPAPDAPGQRPPLYLTRVPTEGFRLNYRVERGELRGRGMFRLDMQEDGGYRVHLQGEDGRSMVMDWISQGRFDSSGVAPERMVERQRGRDVRAVNFQRDQGVVSYSSSSVAFALMPGAQDRASVLLQLMAIAQAQPAGLRAGQVLRMQVASPRAQASEWRFEVAGDEVLELDGTSVPTVRLVREPAQPYDQRIEVWLARGAGGHLPVGLRLTTLPGREPVGLWLEGRLPAAPDSKDAPSP